MKAHKNVPGVLPVGIRFLEALEEALGVDDGIGSVRNPICQELDPILSCHPKLSS